MTLTNLEKLSEEDRLIRAKIALYKKSPFLGYVLSQLKMIECKEGRYLPANNRTMGVDYNRNVYWAREFIKEISEEQLIGLIAHEVFHICLMHMERRSGRNPLLFNIANDIIVNYVLLKDGFKLPPKGVIPKGDEITILGTTIKNIGEKSSEEIYEELYKITGGGFGSDGTGEGTTIIMEGNSSGEGEGEGDGKEDEGEGTGKGKLPKPLDEHILGESSDEQKKETGRIVREGATLAKQQGDLSKAMERHIEGIFDSKVDWRTLLIEFITAQIPYDYTWSLPSKKTASLGIYLPKELRESLEVVFHIDTSGSMSDTELREALSELKGILDSYSNVNIQVLVGDASMTNTFKLTSNNSEDIINFAKELTGGGGTDHRYVFEYVEEEMPSARVLICYTDLYTTFPEEKDYGFKTFWLATKHSAGKVPFGTMIKMSEEE